MQYKPYLSIVDAKSILGRGAYTMHNVLRVRTVEIGVNQPKIIVPIVKQKYEDILEQAEILRNMQIDLVEWRADFYEEIFNLERTLNLLSELRIVLLHIPLLFTFRTRKEGGEKEISMEAYTKLNITAAQSGKVDLVDVEMLSSDDIAIKIIEEIHKTKVFVVGSYHDFHATPQKDVLVGCFRKMQDMGADILKIAVMPHTMIDVLNLFAAANEMYELYADRPIVAISMSAKGLISRIAGEAFGSAMTFGAVGQTSAPGQIQVKDLAKILDILHELLTT